MTDQPARLPRKPFGYDPSVVDQMLADRDSMLAHAERRIREAETKAAKLQDLLTAAQTSIREMNERVVAEPAPPEPEEEPLTPRFMTEELAKIIMAAEESTSQILARARLSTREQILEADRLWSEVQGEVARFAGWRERAATAASAVQSAIETARAQIEGVPARIESSLAAAMEAIARVDAKMGAFASASSLPPLATPSGLEVALDAIEPPSSDGMPAVDGAAPEQGTMESILRDPATRPTLDPGTMRAIFSQEGGVAGPAESDWPSLGEPPSLNEGDEVDGLAAEATHELRGFQTAAHTTDADIEDGSTVWGA